MESIGEKIRIQRLTKNYSQSYMSFMLDISQSAYSKIERDETELSVKRIYEIAEILEISPFTLLPPPKHGTAVNASWFRDRLDKLVLLWTRYIAKRKVEMRRRLMSTRDTSNTEQK